jgi:hypothetical protein
MRFIQFTDEQGAYCLGLVQGNSLNQINSHNTLLSLAKAAISSKKGLLETALEALGQSCDYEKIITEGRLTSPILHDDPAHVLVSGTGLTHLGSADTRASMHAKLEDEDNLTDSMKMFRMGLEGGKPSNGNTGVAPEWFYKGDGQIVVAPGAALPSPAFALDGGEEPEIAGVYLIGEDGLPYRLGFCLGNEFSDHKTEAINYLYLAHSKLRHCAIGPELLCGDLPRDIKGQSRIIRDDEVVWQKEFLSGEDNMSHSIANLEHHHFKYKAFLRPGDIHIHFFGTGTLSFGDGFETREGDIFEIESATFGKPLRNRLEIEANTNIEVQSL